MQAAGQETSPLALWRAKARRRVLELDAEHDLGAFVPLIDPTYERPRHLAPLCEIFDRIERGEAVRVLIDAPPRHAKTDTALAGLVRRLKRRPELTVGYASYADKFAWSKSRRARRFAANVGIELDPGTNAVNEWRTTRGGGFLASGIGGSFTGHGLDIGVLDDPYSDRQDAESPARREHVWDFVTSVFLTRIEPGASAIVTHTRWIEDDVIGRLKETGNWEHIHLPAIALEGDVLGREEGEALWPDRWSREALDEKRAEVGEHDWWSLYMGEPRPRGERLFGEPTRYDETAEKLLVGARIGMACDPAATEKTHSDNSAVVVGAFRGYGRDMTLDILDVWMGQLEIPALCDELLDRQAEWSCPLIVEAHGVGVAVPQMLRRIEPDLRLETVSVKPEKFIHWQPVAAAWNRGRIRVPKQAPWLPRFLSILGKATGVKDRVDDPVDALAHLWHWGLRAFSIDPGKRREKQGDRKMRQSGGY